MNKDMEAQIQPFMAGLLAEGLSLSEIQERVNAEFKLKLTYMDIRILASGISGVDWKARDPKAAAAKPEEKKEAADSDAAESDAAAPAAGEGKTVVEISKLARPGVAISGSVRFGSGPTAEWFIDNTGRLGLDNLQGGQPTQDDVRDFQRELSRLLESGR